MGKFILSAFADEYADDFTEQLEGLKGFGIDFIELRFINKVNIADLSADDVSDVKSKLEHYGIGVSAIGSPLGKITLDDDLNAHLDKAKRVFETANYFGVENIRFFSFYAPENKKIEDCTQQVFEAVERLIELAEESNVTLCHENEALIYGESPERCLELATHFKNRIKCVFDMGNFVVDGYEPYPHAYNLLREHIEYFHIKDALSAGAIVPPGKGEANISSVLKDFAEDMKKDTFITLEPHLQTFSGLNSLVGKQFDNPFKYPDPKTAFCDAVDKIKGILSEIN